MTAPTKTLKKVVLHWSDGAVEQLSDAAAQAWLDKVSNAYTLHQLRGGEVAPDPWVSVVDPMAEAHAALNALEASMATADQWVSPEEHARVEAALKAERSALRDGLRQLAAYRAALTAESTKSQRVRLPPDRVGTTVKFCFRKGMPRTDEDDGEMKGYFTANVYPEDHALAGRLGEILITIDRAGSTTRGTSGALAKSISRRLQHGESVEEVVKPLVRQRFTPDGPTGCPSIPTATSYLDLIGRWVLKHHGAEKRDPFARAEAPVASPPEAA